MLVSWKEHKLTWERLIECVHVVLKRTYTRQAFHEHEPIRITFQLAKNRLRDTNDRKKASPEETRLSWLQPWRRYQP